MIISSFFFGPYYFSPPSKVAKNKKNYKFFLRRNIDFLKISYSEIAQRTPLVRKKIVHFSYLRFWSSVHHPPDLLPAPAKTHHGRRRRRCYCTNFAWQFCGHQVRGEILAPPIPPSSTTHNPYLPFLLPPSYLPLPYPLLPG